MKGKANNNINEQSIEEGIFSLNLIKSDIYIKGIKIATVEKINIFTLIFQTNINLKSLILDDSLKSFAPQKIDVANMSYSLFSPFKVIIEGKGSFGVIDGHVNLDKQKETVQ